MHRLQITSPRLLIILLAMLSAAIAVSCTPVIQSPTSPLAIVGPEERTLYVGPQWAECADGQQCLQIKYTPDSEWESLAHGIAGFDYEPGYDYELRVNQYPLANPAADGAPFRYDLLTIVSKTVAEESGPALPMSALENTTYTGIYTDTTVTLSAGVYEGAPFVAGGAARPRVTLVQPTAMGDLNDDGARDAAVLLAENSGGSGVFTYLAVVLNQAQTPQNVGTVLIGDRTQIRALTIRSGQIHLSIITQGPDDPFCCPSRKVHLAFALQEGQVVEVNRIDEGRVGLADLYGTSWQLSKLDTNEPIPADVEITLAIDARKVAGFSGCNQYSGAVSAGNGALPQLINIQTLVSTKMACVSEVGNLERAYLTRLANVTQWRYLGGNLALTYQGSDLFGTLVFTPVAK